MINIPGIYQFVLESPGIWNSNVQLKKLIVQVKYQAVEKMLLVYA